jgi:hypothetical protein
MAVQLGDEQAASGGCVGNETEKSVSWLLCEGT